MALSKSFQWSIEQKYLKTWDLATHHGSYTMVYHNRKPGLIQLTFHVWKLIPLNLPSWQWKLRAVAANRGGALPLPNVDIGDTVQWVAFFCLIKPSKLMIQQETCAFHNMPEQNQQTTHKTLLIYTTFPLHFFLPPSKKKTYIPPSPTNRLRHFWNPPRRTCAFISWVKIWSSNWQGARPPRLNVKASKSVTCRRLVAR